MIPIFDNNTPSLEKWSYHKNFAIVWVWGSALTALRKRCKNERGVTAQMSKFKTLNMRQIHSYYRDYKKIYFWANLDHEVFHSQDLLFCVSIIGDKNKFAHFRSVNFLEFAKKC